MKNIVRAIVVVLALSGAVASTQTPSVSVRNTVKTARASFLPVPICAPNDPNACGMGTH